MLIAVVAVAAAEALLLLGIAVYYLAGLLDGAATDTAGAAVTGALAVLVGAFLLLCARQLLLGRRWARAPVLTWQLLQAFVAAPTIGGERAWIGWPLLVASLVVLVGLFVPAVMRATTTTAEADPRLF